MHGLPQLPGPSSPASDGVILELVQDMVSVSVSDLKCWDLPSKSMKLLTYIPGETVDIVSKGVEGWRDNQGTTLYPLGIFRTSRDLCTHPVHEIGSAQSKRVASLSRR